METKTQLAPAKRTALKWLFFAANTAILFFAYSHIPAPLNYLLSAALGAILFVGSAIYLNRRKPEWGWINLIISYPIPMMFGIAFRPNRGLYRSLEGSQQFALMIQWLCVWSLTLILIFILWNLIVTSRQNQNS